MKSTARAGNGACFFAAFYGEDAIRPRRRAETK